VSAPRAQIADYFQSLSPKEMNSVLVIVGARRTRGQRDTVPFAAAAAAAAAASAEADLASGTLWVVL